MHKLKEVSTEAHIKMLKVQDERSRLLNETQ